MQILEDALTTRLKASDGISKACPQFLPTILSHSTELEKWSSNACVNRKSSYGIQLAHLVYRSNIRRQLYRPSSH